MVEEETIFDLFEQITPTNKSLSITITPNQGVIKYEYNIIQQEEIESKVINHSLPETIVLEKTGNYQIEVITYDRFNNETRYNSGTYIIDKEKPSLILKKTSLDVILNQELDVLDFVSVYDNQDGDLLEKVITNYDELNLSEIGNQTLIYSVTDQAGNQAFANLEINIYKPQWSSAIGTQNFIIWILGLILIFLIRYQRILKREKRLTKYSINPLVDNSLSLGDWLILYYKKIIDKIGFVLNKSVFITNYSNRYDKYINVINNTYFTGLDYVSEKFLISFLFGLMAFLSKLVHYELISIYEVIIPLIFGFFLPDIIYIFKNRKYRNRLENDFLQAITIMNNAFKSGCSIVQAIELVIKELDGPIAKEFSKMAMEINFGLSIDVVFKRFANRIKLEEARYLTATLTILTKTGGNIIKVFSSIEKTLFNKKTLKLELKALTGSSKMIVTILTLFPLFFVLIVNLINSSYFIPLYTTSIGKIIILIMLIIYSAYIYVIQKFIRVRL